MRTNVAPFLWFLAAFTFAVVWGQQHKTAYLLLAVVFAILAVRSYAATKKGAFLSAASSSPTTSASDQTRDEIPASIAGVTRSV